jgi:molybdopterin-guanine dinucleotide biosynthesis protein MobB
MMIQSPTPVMGLAAWSGAGKTQLLKKIIPLLKQQGLRLALIKHAHHDFDIDHPGKDSHVLRQAGATQVLIASNRRWAMMTEQAQNPDPCLADLLPHLAHEQLDLILVEGFRHEAFPKIEVYRPALAKPLLYPNDPHIIAIATDGQQKHPLPTFDLNQPRQLTQFIQNLI